MNELDDIKQNEQKDLKLINESDFFITICEQYKTNEEFLKDEFQETLKKSRDYLDLCNFMGYRQLNDVICEYAEKIRNCDIIDFNKFLSENNGSPIWNHLELLEENLFQMEEDEWKSLSLNTAAIHLLKQNLDKINWKFLSANPTAIHLLERNLDKVDWQLLSENPAAIHILEREIKEAEENERDCRVRWNALSANPAAIHLLERNLDKVSWFGISVNTAAIHILEREIKEAEENERDCRVRWNALSANPAAIHLLEMEIENPKKNKRDCIVDWNGLSRNPVAIHLLEREIEEAKKENRDPRVNLDNLSKNPYEYLNEKLLVLEKMRLLPETLNTKTILQTYIQSLKKKGRYDDYIIYSDLEN